MQTNVQSGALTLPLNRITSDAPWRWLERGWRDLLRAPHLSLAYGTAFAAIGILILAGSYLSGLSALIPALGACFMLAGPILALGLYEKSRRLAAGERVTLGDMLRVRPASPLQIAYVGFFLTFAMLLWMRIATLLFALFFSGAYVPLTEFVSFAISTPEGLSMLVIGTVIGGLIALAVFALAAISVPLLMARRTDMLTAMATSVKAVFDYPAAMLLWAWLIALLIAAGIATGFIGLIIVFPLVGHATWHAYSDFFGSSGTSAS